MSGQKSWFDISVLFSLLMVLALHVYPMPLEWMAWRPHFVLMLCCYLKVSRAVPWSVEFTCLAGLLTDIVSGSVLGSHALSLCLAVALLGLVLPRLQHGGLAAETFIIGLVTLLAELVLQSLNLMFLDAVYTDWVLYPAIATLVAWPLFRIAFSRLIPVPVS